MIQLTSYVGQSHQKELRRIKSPWFIPESPPNSSKWWRTRCRGARGAGGGDPLLQGSDHHPGGQRVRPRDPRLRAQAFEFIRAGRRGRGAGTAERLLLGGRGRAGRPAAVRNDGRKAGAHRRGHGAGRGAPLQAHRRGRHPPVHAGAHEAAGAFVRGAAGARGRGGRGAGGGRVRPGPEQFVGCSSGRGAKWRTGWTRFCSRRARWPMRKRRSPRRSRFRCSPASATAPARSHPRWRRWSAKGDRAQKPTVGRNGSRARRGI